MHAKGAIFVSYLIVDVRVSDLKPGQTVGETIYDLHNRPLLCKGVTLTPSHIARLMVRDYIEFVKIQIPYDESSKGIIKPAEPLKNISPAIHKKLGRFFQKARNIDRLEDTTVEELSKDIHPLIETIFNTEPSILDNLQMLSGHDDHTHEHSWTVMLISLSILRSAEIMGIIRPTDQDKHDLALGSILHDIGKTKVPLKILNKPGKLTPKEWGIMQKHPTFGYHMVKNTPNLMPVAKAVVAHHHRFLDGTGYSAEGVQELETIPNHVRIVTIADIYDAIVSERPYHVAALPYHALKILFQGADKRFDKRFVQALSNAVAPFPNGCFLLYKGGILGQVEEVPPKRKDNPFIRIIATFSEAYTNLLNKTFHFQEPLTGLPTEDELLLGAYSPNGLANKIKGALSLGKARQDILGSTAPTKIYSLRSFEDILCKAFAFLFVPNMEAPQEASPPERVSI